MLEREGRKRDWSRGERGQIHIGERERGWQNTSERGVREISEREGERGWQNTSERGVREISERGVGKERL